MNAIELNHVSIRYLIGDFKDIGLKEYVLRKLKHNYYVEEFWADRDITFSLPKGRMLGIIGTNGAGKSTILKAISGIMVPTEGTIGVNGRVAALLELTSGFDGDLTVLENAYLRGAMLGYTRQFMDEKIHEIIDFAELHGYENRPFKQLSSGMKSRLAFSIASLVNPDILILDEVLSVGDGAFRKKSGNKMKDILSKGVTGILVSHTMAQVREMCDTILWLDKGKQLYFGTEVEMATSAYEESMITKKIPQNIDQIKQLSVDYLKRVEEQKYKKQMTETQKLLNILEAGNSDAAIQAALEILRKSAPELLKSEINELSGGKER